MSITIKDVAKHAGVGIGTVSRVINGTGAVRSATRQRVLASIKELDYVPNSQARRLSLGKTMTIGVIAPFFTSQSVVERLRGIETVVSNSNYELIIFNIDTVQQLDRYTRNLSRQDRIDGLLVISMKANTLGFERLEKANFPTVIVDAENHYFPTVTIDDVAGGVMATTHLINLGHRRIGFVSDILMGDLGNNSSFERFNGYKKALADFNIPFDQELVKALGLSRQHGYQMAKEILQSPNRPTAIVAGSDVLASGVFQAARELNLEIPYDLSLIGYDDIELAEFMNLTTIRQPLFDSGRRGAEMLLEYLSTPESPPNKSLLPINVVIRGSTARAPR